MVKKQHMTKKHTYYKIVDETYLNTLALNPRKLADLIFTHNNFGMT